MPARHLFLTVFVFALAATTRRTVHAGGGGSTPRQAVDAPLPSPLERPPAAAAWD